MMSPLTLTKYLSTHSLQSTGRKKNLNTLNALCTHLCQMCQLGNFMFLVLGSKGIIFHAFKLLCEECLLCIKYGHQRIKQKANVFDQICPAAPGIFFLNTFSGTMQTAVAILIDIRAALCSLQSTSVNQTISRLVSFCRRFAKNMVSVVH